jgi:hypothetical protein
MILFLLLLVMSNSANAQQGRGYFYKNTDKVFYGGAVAGVNFSALNGDVYDGFHKLGFNGGGVVYGRIFRRLLMSVELLYTMKGCRGVKVYNSYYSGTFVEKYYTDLNYAEIPVVFHFLLNDKWNIGLGGAYAQLLKSKEDVLTDQPVYIDPAKHPFRKEEYSIVLSAGMQLYNGWFLSLRYQNSLTTIRDLDKIPIGFGGGKQTNSVFTLRLMYLLK